jgi:hypothetical protein
VALTEEGSREKLIIAEKNVLGAATPAIHRGGHHVRVGGDQTLHERFRQALPNHNAKVRPRNARLANSDRQKKGHPKQVAFQI